MTIAEQSLKHSPPGPLSRWLSVTVYAMKQNDIDRLKKFVKGLKNEAYIACVKKLYAASRKTY